MVLLNFTHSSILLVSTFSHFFFSVYTYHILCISHNHSMNKKEGGDWKDGKHIKGGCEGREERKQNCKDLC